MVAGEVKKLSQDTALATGDVLAKIEAINTTCTSFLTSFDTIGTNVDALHRSPQPLIRQSAVNGS